MKTLKSLLIFCAILMCTGAYGTTVTSTVPGGDWSNAGTWDVGVPGCYDTIIIPAGSSVNMASTVNLEGCGAISMIVYGNLHFNQSFKLELPCSSWVLFMPGGTLTADDYGNNSKQLKICGAAVWKGKDGQATGPTGFGGAPLPIELLFFTAQLGDDDRTVELKWATASEADNDFFTLERSANGTDWIPLVEVAGAGNSSQRIDYQERDKQPLFGDSYYRLKQTDYNGDFTYSPAVNVSQNGLTEMEMYPNPVNIGADVILNFPESSKDIIDVNILSMDGKLVHQSTYDISSTHQIILNIGLEFLPGLYLVKTELISAKLVVR